MNGRLCPRCRSYNAAPVVYGLPLGDSIRAAERGEVILGGCVHLTAYNTGCLDCGAKWVHRYLPVVVAR